MSRTYLESLNQMLKQLLSEDERIYVLGEDILDPYGGAFKVTRGLSSKFPDKVVATPISEASLAGIAIGMAMRGLKPILEIMFGDFITLCADQIINHASKFQTMYSQQVNVPLVIRTPMGGGRGYGPTHSQSLEKHFLGTPYLNIVAPSHFHDPGNLLRYSIMEDTKPTLFIEQKLLYSKKLLTDVEAPLSVKQETRNSDYSTAVVRNYEASTYSQDVTLISYGGISRLLEPVLKKLYKEEIRVLSYLPSLISSPSIDYLLSQLDSSSKVIIVEESTECFNWGAEIAAQIAYKFKGCNSIKRIAANPTIIPAARHLEKKMLPSVESIEQAIIEELM